MTTHLVLKAKQETQAESQESTKRWPIRTGTASAVSFKHPSKDDTERPEAVSRPQYTLGNPLEALGCHLPAACGTGRMFTSPESKLRAEGKAGAEGAPTAQAGHSEHRPRTEMKKSPVLDHKGKERQRKP